MYIVHTGYTMNHSLSYKHSKVSKISIICNNKKSMISVNVNLRALRTFLFEAIICSI